MKYIHIISNLKFEKFLDPPPQKKEDISSLMNLYLLQIDFFIRDINDEQ